MNSRLISIPSLKYKRKKRPSRTLSQQAPLANYDEFQLSDVSDSEDNPDKNSHSVSPVVSKLQHYHSSDEANSDKINCLIDYSEFSDKKNVSPDTEEIKIEEENNGENDIGKENDETLEGNLTQDDTKMTDETNCSNDVIYEAEDEEEEEEEIEKERLEKDRGMNDDYNEDETEEQMEYEEGKDNLSDEDEDDDEQSNQETKTEENELNAEDYCENNSYQEETEQFENNNKHEIDDENELENDFNKTNENKNINQDILFSDDQNCDLEKVVASEYSGIATEPNTSNDQSMDEYSQKNEECNVDDSYNQYQREEYYDYVEEPVQDAGDDPFSLEYHQTKETNYQSYSENNEPPQIVITEPSDLDLPSLDGSKATKPSRPPELPKNVKIPKRPPPPPSISQVSKKTDTELRSIPPPPASTKRRDRKQEEDFVLNKQTKFPFKSHFDKKPTVPNPKKAILNVLKGESKKERKRRKAEEEFERILNTVNTEEAPICESTDEWKAYKEFQERISASVLKSQEKIKSILEEETVEKPELDKEESKEATDSQNWALFEDKENQQIGDLDIFKMSTVNEMQVNDIDIWGCENNEILLENDLTDFNKEESIFVETFNQRIEDVDDDFFEKESQKASANVVEDSFTNFDDAFGITDEIKSQGIENDNLDKTETIVNRKERPKPQRQETLSGNNPFRKASLNSENENMQESDKEEESPFITVLKSIGITNLDEAAPGFDPLTTIYPDSGDEKPSSNEDDISSHSSTENFQPFKITTTINVIDSVNKDDTEPVKILPSPNISTPRGPRERKLPPEKKPFGKAEKEAEVDELFADIRTDNSKNLLEIDEDQNVIRFDSPLSGKFSGEQIEWEAFPTNHTKMEAEEEEEAVWGENSTFKTEFEPLPGEIVTFEPFYPKNENMEWKLLIRQPEKKSKAKQISRYTSNRWWKETYLRLSAEKDRPCLKFYDNLEDSEPYRTIRMEPYMQLSRDKLQQYDKYGKLHIFKVNHVVYKEMVGMRTEKFSFKTLQNLVSHKPKMNMVLDHMPLRTEIVKVGSLDQKPLRSLMTAIEDSMMSIKIHRDASLEYTKEEVCCYVNDEYECELNENGSILNQKARTRILFAAFVIGNPHIVLGINDKWRFGNEIVRRQDIIPIMHDDWINIYEPEFHSCIDMDEYEKDHMIKFYPLDGCKFELMRFRVPLRPNKELPLSADVKIKTHGIKVDIRVDLSVPGFFSASKRHGAVHCDDIEIRIPIPEEWAYHFRIEKHTKYGSMHSALRKPGKIKGFERITQIAQSFLPPSMLEASAGIAKYEHLYRAIVWRIPRLPEKNEASYKPHMMTCKLILAPHDTVPPPDEMVKTFFVEFTMSASTVSGATVRSISLEHTATPERFVKYLATFKYTRNILYEWGDAKPAPIKGILDQNIDQVEETHSSDESHQEKSSPSENTNSPQKSQKNDSVDLLECSIDPQPSTAQYHSALDDLLTLDCFNNKSSNNEFSQLGTQSNIMDDIAMVDDDHDDT